MAKSAGSLGEKNEDDISSLPMCIKQISLEDRIFEKSANINMLDDHILENIFKQLDDDFELLKMEQVCQKWKGICSNIWKRKCCLGVYNNIDFDTYEELLSRCGSSLGFLLYSIHPDCSNELKLKPDDFNKAIPPIITHCRNLRQLVLIGLNKVEESLLKELTNCSFFPNLTCLSLGDMELSDDVLEIMLDKAINLEDLGLQSITGLKGHGLMKLSTECESLNISGSCFEQEAFVNCFRRIPQLKDLTAYGVENLSLKMLIHQINLVELRASSSEVFKDLVYDEIPPFSFPYLKKLDIRCNGYVSDFALSILHVICPSLEELDLSGCCSSSYDDDEEVSNFGISQLVKLSNLKWLLLNDIRKLNLELIALFVDKCSKNTFGQLEVLACQDSGLQTVKGVSRMISICPKLKVLDLSGNWYLSTEFLESVLNSVNEDLRNFENLTICSSAKRCKIHQDLS